MTQLHFEFPCGTSANCRVFEYAGTPEDLRELFKELQLEERCHVTTPLASIGSSQHDGQMLALERAPRTQSCAGNAYVDYTTGSDSALGTYHAPFKTIGVALLKTRAAAAAAGKPRQVMVRTGAHFGVDRGPVHDNQAARQNRYSLVQESCIAVDAYRPARVEIPAEWSSLVNKNRRCVSASRNTRAHLCFLCATAPPMIASASRHAIDLIITCM
eukprot:SAG11_NODE_2635_length_3149_cov_2.532787_3_plen_215_part_00